jgi:hypothetical protein
MSMNWYMVRSDMDMPIGTFADPGSRIGARHDSDG